MAHLDDEQLSLLALGEDLGTDADRHIDGCQECASTLVSLQRAVLVVTTDASAVHLQEPGSHNWTAIHEALALSPSLAEDPLSAPGGAGDGTPRAEPDGQSGPEGPRTLRPGSAHPRGRPGLWLLGVAAGTAAGLVIGAWTAASILGRGLPPFSSPGTSAPAPTEPSAELLAEAPLQPVAAHSASGNAVVQQLADGSRRLVVRLPDEPLSGFREVWVGSPDLSRLISLGVLDRQAGVFVIPRDLDLAQYPVVDVSNEPYDGVPAHSADSIARGVLTRLE